MLNSIQHKKEAQWEALLIYSFNIIIFVVGFLLAYLCQNLFKLKFFAGAWKLNVSSKENSPHFHSGQPNFSCLAKRILLVK